MSEGKHLNPLGKAVYSTEKNSKLDESVKNLLSQKPILAYLLKYAVKEFEQYSIEDIMPMIDKIHVATIPVEPGLTNGLITGETQESKIVGEGTVTYDVRFIATLPDIKGSEYNLIINVEGQAKQELPYWVESRGIAYCARMISEQIGRNVIKSHYENLQKVYSIWICMNSAEKDANTVYEYGMQVVNRVGELTVNPRIDLLSVIVIRLPKDDQWDKAGSPSTDLTEMLATLLSNKISPDEKISALENKFGIEATETIRKEVNDMCNYSAAVRSEGYNAGADAATTQTELANIKSLMKKKGWTAEEAMDTLDIEPAKRDKYAAILSGTPATA